jgi:hypothetical protein
VLSATGFSVERDPNKTYILTNIWNKYYSYIS